KLRGSFCFSKKLKMSLLKITSGGRLSRPRYISPALCRLDSLKLPCPILQSASGDILKQLDIQAQRVKLFDQHVEALWQARIKGEITFDDRLIDSSTTLNVVRLNGQEFLKRVGCAVRLDCPDLHLTESLTTELSLTTERLLRDEAVRSNRTSVDLIVDKVVQLEHVHDSAGHIVIKRLSSPAVEEHTLTR